MSSKNTLIGLIALVVVVVGAVVIINESNKGPLEDAADEIEDAVDDVADEIEDNTN